MIYDDGTGRRIYRPLRGGRRPLEGKSEPSYGAREAILRVVADHPRWGPAGAEIQDSARDSLEDSWRRRAQGAF